MSQYSASVIVSFYNRIEYLKLILAALEEQSFRDFEVVIADDGSKPAVVDEIVSIAKTSPIPIQHVWHEDDGFRKTTILNKAIVSARSAYLIFIDGDCIPHTRFVEEHLNNRAGRTVLAGRRANVSPKIAHKLTVARIRSGYLESRLAWDLIVDGLLGKSHHVIKGIYVSHAGLRRFLNRRDTGVLGSNFSIHKQDMLDVNGFDERYKAPAVGEDTDLEARLRWNGISVRMIKNMAVQYHIDHPKLKRSHINDEIFRQVQQEKKAFTPFGIVR